MTTPIVEDPITTATTRFLPELAHHTMTVVHDDGTLRHLQFRGVGPHAAWLHTFDLVAWTDHLTISGDLGDMTLRVACGDVLAWAAQPHNPTPTWHHWAEKVVAMCEPGLWELSPQKLWDIATDHAEDEPDVETLTEALTWMFDRDIDSDGQDIQQLTFRAAVLMLAVRHGANLYYTTTHTSR